MEFLAFLAPDGEKCIVALGASLLPQLALGEPWALIAVVGEELVSGHAGHAEHEGTAGMHRTVKRSRIVAEAVPTRTLWSPIRKLWLEASIFKVDKGGQNLSFDYGV